MTDADPTMRGIGMTAKGQVLAARAARERNPARKKALEGEAERLKAEGRKPGR
ncbi:MAG: hypothetical protein ABI051_19055 [Vicinamibacterales bacterium]